MTTLRERLSRFDRSLPPRVAAAPRRRELGWAHELGMQASGDGPAGHLFRTVDLPPLASLDAPSWYRLNGERSAPPFPWAILDTETTGLESGTGTLVFLTGVLRLDSGGARLTQRFLTEPAGEASLLAAFCDDLRGVTALLSYNGKSFDLPRLRSRLRLHRMAVAPFDCSHLDLVHVCRRIASPWLEDAKLASMEQHLLGIRRQGDVAGYEVPEIYRRWLQEADSDRLEHVVLHNQRDVVNLHTLALRLAKCVQSPNESGLPPPACAAIGRLLEARALFEEAEQCYEFLLAQVDVASRRGIVLRLARLARRRGDSERARELWRSIAGPSPEGILARIELAKLFEHHQRDWTAAAEQTEAALGELGAEASVRRTEPMRLALQHRLERLKRKRLGAAEMSA